MRTTTARTGFFALLLAFATAIGARADAVAFSDCQGSDGTWRSGYRALNIPKFDPGLGTLTSVTLSNWQETVQANLDVETTVDDMEFQGIKLKEINKLDAILNETVFASTSFTFTTPHWNDDDLDEAGYEEVTIDQPYSQMWSGIWTLADRTFTLPSDLAMFTGTGDVLLGGMYVPAGGNLLSISSLREFNGGNFISELLTKATICATVTYNFTPVPEPGASAMGLVALAAVALAIRRRKLGRSA